MARDTDHLTGGFETENTGGFLSGLLAEEDHFDRRALLRLGAWGAVTVGAVIVAVMTNQSTVGSRRELVAAADLARQSQQIQSVARDGQNEARRLASAIETLNGDRDRLYARVTVLEQGLDTATGAIARQSPAPSPAQSPAAAASPQAATAPAAAEPPSTAQNPPPAQVAAIVVPPSPSPSPAPAAASAPAPVPAPVATTTVPPEKPGTETALDQSPAAASSAGQAAAILPAPSPTTPLVASKSIMAPPDPAAGKLIRSEPPAGAIVSAPMPEVVASVSNDDAEPDATPAPGVAVQRTEFGVDVGGANSVNGLRALWRGLMKSNSTLGALRPLIAIKEGRNGFGMQLRLIAGPIGDAATAAKICAALTESKRSCETALFDGQRLAMKANEPPFLVKPALRRRGSVRRGVSEEPPKKPDSPATLSSLFKRERPPELK